MKYLQTNNKIIVIKIPHINNKTNKTKNTKEDKRKQKTIKQKSTKQDIVLLLPEINQAIVVRLFVFSSIQIHLGRID